MIVKYFEEKTFQSRQQRWGVGIKCLVDDSSGGKEVDDTPGEKYVYDDPPVENHAALITAVKIFSVSPF